MNNLAEEQELMKERWNHRRRRNGSLMSEEGLEQEELDSFVARKDHICPFCKEKPTTASKADGRLFACRSCTNKSAMLRKYGITLPEYFAMLSQQQGKCAICDEIMVKVCVDHCHALGHHRGLLCSSCNLGLGCFKDNSETLKRAAKYLNNNLFSRNWNYQENVPTI